MVLDTAYVGELFRHLQDNRNLNYVPYGAAFLPQNQDPTAEHDCAAGIERAAAPTSCARCSGIADINLYESAATGNYNSLQVTLDRRVGQPVPRDVLYLEQESDDGHRRHQLTSARINSPGWLTTAHPAMTGARTSP